MIVNSKRAHSTGFVVIQGRLIELFRTVNLRHRAFSVAGPVCWNSLPDYLKSSDLSLNCFRQQLKHFYFVNIDTSPSTTLAH